MVAIESKLLTESDLLSPALYHILHHPVIWISVQTRVFMALGIVFLMTIKPDLTGSLLAIGIATLLGLASALPILSRERALENPIT